MHLCPICNRRTRNVLDDDDDDDDERTALLTFNSDESLSIVLLYAILFTVRSVFCS